MVLPTIIENTELPGGMGKVVSVGAVIRAIITDNQRCEIPVTYTWHDIEELYTTPDDLRAENRRLKREQNQLIQALMGYQDAAARLSDELIAARQAVACVVWAYMMERAELGRLKDGTRG